MTKLALFVLVILAVGFEVTARASRGADPIPPWRSSSAGDSSEEDPLNIPSAAGIPGLEGLTAADAANIAVIKELASRRFGKPRKSTSDKLSEAVAKILSEAAVASAIRKDPSVTHVEAYITGERPNCPLTSILQLFRQSLQEIRDEILQAIRHSASAQLKRRSSEPDSLESEEKASPQARSNALEELKKQLRQAIGDEGHKVEEDGTAGNMEEDGEDDGSDQTDEEDHAAKRRGNPMRRTTDDDDDDDEDEDADEDDVENELNHVMKRSNLYPPAAIHQLQGPGKRRLSRTASSRSRA